MICWRKKKGEPQEIDVESIAGGSENVKKQPNPLMSLCWRQIMQDHFLAAAAAAKNGVVETLESILFCFDVSFWMDTPLGSNISPPKGMFEDDVPLPRAKKNWFSSLASFILLMVQKPG